MTCVLRFRIPLERCAPDAVVVATCEDRVVLADSEHPELARFDCTPAQARHIACQLVRAADQIDPPDGGASERAA